MPAKSITLKVLPSEAGSRLDAWLTQKRPERSRNQWATAIRSGQVLVDGKPAKARHLIKRGQVVNFAPTSLVVKPQSKQALSIIHQDKDILAINKPAGLVMHPAGRHQSGTLLDILEAKFSEAYLVHRLDKDTSGVVLVARNLRSKEFLSSAFAKHRVKKTYLALVVGKLTPRQAYLDLPIKRGRSGKFEVHAGGRAARSFYKVAEYLPGFSLVEVHPESGRTHQIRVHFKALPSDLPAEAVPSPRELADADPDAECRNSCYQNRRTRSANRS